MIKNVLIAISLLLLLVATAWFGWQLSQKPNHEPMATPATTTTPLATLEDTANVPVPPPLPKTILNLEIPKEHFLMDTLPEVPEQESWLKGLFKPREKEKSVKVGGTLIMNEEKSTDPNAAVWDQVKGAEVEITIPTH